MHTVYRKTFADRQKLSHIRIIEKFRDVCFHEIVQKASSHPGVMGNLSPLILLLFPSDDGTPK